MIKKITIISMILMSFFWITGINCFANENKWVYYSNANDVGRLYKIKNDGTKMTRLSIQTANDIEILGEWIYYFNNSQTGGAFRTKIDGSKTEKLVDGFENECYGIYKDGGHIYIPYIDGGKISYGERGYYYSCILIYDKNDYVSKINVNAAENSLQTARCIEAANDCIYFSLNDDYSGEADYYMLKINFESNPVNVQKTDQIKKLPSAVSKKAENKTNYRVDTDFYRDKYLCWKEVKGAEKYIVYHFDPKSEKYKKLAETYDTEINITVANSEYNNKYKVIAIKNINNVCKQYKVKMLENSTNELSIGSFATKYKNSYYYCGKNGIYFGGEKISNKKADCMCIANEKLYFSDWEGIHKMNTDCTDETMIFSAYERDINCIAVFDGKLLISYENNSEAYDMHTIIINLADGKNEEISNTEIKDICAVNNKIIFIGGDDMIYSMNRDGSDIRCISESYANSICSYNNKVYYCNDNGIFTINYDGTEFKRLYDTNAIDIAVCNDKIYFLEMHEKKLSPINYHVCSINIDGMDFIEYMNNNYINNIEVCSDYIFIGDILGNCNILNNV